MSSCVACLRVLNCNFANIYYASISKFSNRKNKTHQEDVETRSIMVIFGIRIYKFENMVNLAVIHVLGLLVNTATLLSFLLLPNSQSPWNHVLFCQQLWLLSLPFAPSNLLIFKPRAIQLFVFLNLCSGWRLYLERNFHNLDECWYDKFMTYSFSWLSAPLGNPF